MECTTVIIKCVTTFGVRGGGRVVWRYRRVGTDAAAAASTGSRARPPAAAPPGTFLFHCNKNATREKKREDST